MFKVNRTFLATAWLALLVSACGGGGGGGNADPPASLVVTSPTLSVSATTADLAPTGTISVYVSADPNSSYQYHLAGTYTQNGIASISAGSSGSAANYTVQFKAPSALGVGTFTDTVTIKGCYDSACNRQIQDSPQTVAVTYTVSAGPPPPTPQLSLLTPASAPAGSADLNLSLDGANFTTQSQVRWNGSIRTTTFVSTSRLTATIPSADLAAVGTAAVTVSADSSAASASSNALQFDIIQPPPFALTSISPSTVAVGGGDFTLTLVGTSFAANAQVLWNGSARPTTVVSTTQLLAQISSADIAAAGVVQIAVKNNGAAPATSNALPLTIKVMSSGAVAFQMTPGHSGAVTFKSMSLPTASSWSVDVGGTPSYALIVDGKVIVTVTVGNGSQLLALDQATGATLWGPIVLAGAANAAYDNGKVFVVSGQFGSAALMQAYDVASGALDWSALLSGQYAFSSGPTALNGVVYTGGAGSGGTLYALNEATGALQWTQSVMNGDSSTPAVTNVGVYVTYPCTTYGFEPATGATLIYNNTGCEGGGGATPVVANNVLYSPNGSGGGYSGTTFNATSGALLGNYVADVLPAIGSTTGYFLQSGTLRGVTLANNTVAWSFAGDGTLVTSPILVNQTVFIGSSSGNVYGLDALTGQQQWLVNVGATIPGGAGWGARMPLSGLAAGEGWLIIPAGTTLTAYQLSTNP